MKATPLFNASEVRHLEALAETEYQLNPYTLMQRAAAAALTVCRRHYPRARHLHVVCGPGNNGGDGVELARQAADVGLTADVISAADLSASGGAAANAWQAFSGAGGAISRQELGNVQRHDVIIDGLFGTGLSRAPRGAAALLIEAINAAPAPCLALDIPSGVHADTGACMTAAVRAHHTVSFIAPKAGLVIGDGPLHAGRVHVATLDVPAALLARATPSLHQLGQPQWPLRNRRAHKGDHGRVVIIGGAQGMEGAATLAGKAALSSGAGLVRVARPASAARALRSASPELMDAQFASASELSVHLASAAAVVIGPGLGVSALARSAFDSVCQTDRPMIVDADALRLLAEAPRAMTGHVLTPHPGEAAALLGVSVADIESNRPEALAELVSRYRATVVLKGFRTLLGSPGAVPRCVPFGNPGLATGGSGDVLAGLVAAMRVAHDPFAAASCGALLHAVAADRAAKGGERGLSPSDVIETLRQCVN
ncbi:MAG: NAD(P)H-hydrate dehydratase [Pseudomonadota bacterium]